ncbi:MAG: hypothetical protein IPO32_19830 [Crocinitomicaceae bacterium]|nr:hypothetical protein [Crocinitomicaceae bacterium]
MKAHFTTAYKVFNEFVILLQHKCIDLLQGTATKTSSIIISAVCGSTMLNFSPVKSTYILSLLYDPCAWKE